MAVTISEGPTILILCMIIYQILHCFLLHGTEEGLPVLDWQKRMKIAIGSARGLKYLHEDCMSAIFI